MVSPRDATHDWSVIETNSIQAGAGAEMDMENTGVHAENMLHSSDHHLNNYVTAMLDSMFRLCYSVPPFLLENTLWP